VVTSNTKSELAVNEIRHAVLAAGELYGKRPELFKLFGDFDGTKDLLFKVRSSRQTQNVSFLLLLSHFVLRWYEVRSPVLVHQGRKFGPQREAVTEAG
jgi:hypothetical protein